MQVRTSTFPNYGYICKYRITYHIDMRNPNSDTTTDRDASPTSYSCDGADTRIIGQAPDPIQTTREHDGRQYSNHTHPVPQTAFKHIQYQLTPPTACTLAPASTSTRHTAPLPFMAARWRGVSWPYGDGGEEQIKVCDRDNHVLGIYALWNCQGMGTAHANRLKGH